VTGALLMVGLLLPTCRAQSRPIVLSTETVDRAAQMRRISRRVAEPNPRYGPASVLFQRGRARQPAALSGDWPCQDALRALDQLGFIDRPEERAPLLIALDEVSRCAEQHHLTHPLFTQCTVRRNYLTTTAPFKGKEVIVRAPDVTLFLDGEPLHEDTLPWSGGDVIWTTTDLEGASLPGGSVRVSREGGKWWFLMDLARSEIAGTISELEQTGYSDRLATWAQIYADLVEAPLYIVAWRPLRVWAWCGPDRGLVLQKRSTSGCAL